MKIHKLSFHSSTRIDISVIKKGTMSEPEKSWFIEHPREIDLW